MPQADGSIIIDTRINNKGAEADLKALQAKAKSTAQQISALDKQLGQATSKRSKLADDLAAARQQAEGTAKALDEINAKLDAARAKNLAAVQKEFPGMSAGNAASIAESRTKGQYGADFARSDQLAAEYAKQTESIARLTGEYQRQEQTVAGLTQQRAGLVSQLGQEKKAVDQATASYDRQQKKQAQNSPARQINTASKAMSRFGGRMREIVSGALLFNIISSGLSALVGWIGSALQSTSAFGQALRNLQGAASVAAAPLIDALGNALAYVINLLATAMSYLARFISMLTGKSLSAMKTSAKAMNSYGSAAGNAAKETEKATRSLAGFDEITRLDAPQESSSGGAGGAGAAAPNYDFVDQTGAGFSALLDKVQSVWDRFTAAIAPSVAAWNAAWQQIKATALAVLPQIQAAASGLWTNALQPLLTYLTGTWAPGMINAFSQAFAPIVGDVLSGTIVVWADLFTWWCGILTDGINNIVVPVMDLLLYVWQGAMEGIQTAWSQYGQPLVDGVITWFRGMESALSNLYYTIIEPIIANVIDLLKRLWDDHLKQLWDDVVAMILSMGQYLLDGWNNILWPLINWLISTFGPLFTDVFNACAGAIETGVGLIVDAIDLAVYAFKGILNFMSAVFRGDWAAAWEAISATVTGVWERIVGAVKGYINGILRAINGMISAIANALNRLNFTVPSWVPGIGGQSVGFTVTAPQIPYLAQGAVIPPNKEFLAVLGDQRSGTNVEAPLATIQQAVAAVMQDNLDGELAALEQVIAVLRQILEAVYGIHIGDAVIGQAVARYNSRQAIITGRA